MAGETVKVRIDESVMDKVREKAEEIEAKYPGVYGTISTVLRSAVQEYVNERCVRYMIPEDATDGDLLAFYDALKEVEKKAKTPGLTSLALFASDALVDRLHEILRDPARRRKALKKKAR